MLLSPFFSSQKVSRLVVLVFSLRRREIETLEDALSLSLFLSLPKFFSLALKGSETSSASRCWRTTKQRTRLVCPSTQQRHHHRLSFAVSREEEEEDESNPGLTGGRNFLNRKRKSNTKEGGIAFVFFLFSDGFVENRGAA